MQAPVFVEDAFNINQDGMSHERFYQLRDLLAEKRSEESNLVIYCM